MTTTASDTQIQTTPIDTDGGDHDRFAHYCRKDDLERAILDGVPCTALCGKEWLPTRDPQRYPVCPGCKDIFENVVGTGPGAQ